MLRDVTYATLDGRRNGATIVEPPASSRPRGAVLFVHWYGPPRPTSNRTQFVPDAVELAKSGVVSLLIDTPWSVRSISSSESVRRTTRGRCSR